MILFKLDQKSRVIIVAVVEVESRTCGVKLIRLNLIARGRLSLLTDENVDNYNNPPLKRAGRRSPYAQ